MLDMRIWINLEICNTDLEAVSADNYGEAASKDGKRPEDDCGELIDMRLAEFTLDFDNYI